MIEMWDNGCPYWNVYVVSPKQMMDPPIDVVDG